MFRLSGAILTLGAFLWPLGVVANQIHVVSTADGTGADAHVLNRFPTDNWGMTTTVQIKNAALVNGMYPHDRKTYLRFDLSAVPPGLDEHALALTTSAVGGNPVAGPQDFTVYGLTDGDAGEGWDESLITWTNAPANDTVSATAMLANATVVAGFSLDATGTPDELLLITDPRLNTFVAADTNGRVTLVIVRETYDPDPDGWVHAFYAKEHLTGVAPELWVGDSVTDAPVSRPGVGSAIQLGGAFPHPVRGRAQFAVAVESAVHATLDIYDVRGRWVVRAFEGTLGAGEHALAGPGEVPAGVYFATLRAAGERRTRRFVVLR